MCADSIARISLFTCVHTLSLSAFFSRSFSCIPFTLCIYVIVCFTLDPNCEERRRSFNVRRVCIREEEFTRDKRKKKNNAPKTKKKITYPFFCSSSSSSSSLPSSSSVNSPNDSMLYRLRVELVKVIYVLFTLCIR